MSDTTEQGMTVPFNHKLIDMLDMAADACAKQWPNSDSPAATCRTVAVGIQNGLAELAAAQERAEQERERAERAVQEADKLPPKSSQPEVIQKWSDWRERYADLLSTNTGGDDGA